ncbi:MAG: hypothetical protein A2845_01420 [Candidatus Lloydbacteria bacterium RIFCSPHIGHO2_01_FULL_49_22]|uniref:Uncharacterized protein n=1 Tax=Candidatus Lloydbacteria bacterium RIFCSPHIGHO2_01_FULL_49_22 TaxID=1798658 RepID=A0A1G2CXF7_9BACT|nr:MAG: hypothetical protein A2845_01420 [Candidatus Lloydbacteria bacterium RIFCSPHIGHO2_01_FULL_49_22]OGZ09958.1 MAG: hypothetical protein A3C14_04590 [Candidatus Lloydbacteria bacterium RIFCSPHIGHO2_02_FULL_50_18]
MWGLVDTMLALLVVTGLALNAWGIVMNGVVVEVNDGVMPVISETPGFIMTNYGTPRKFVSDGKLLFLADHIRVDFPDWEKYIPEGAPGIAIRWWGKWLDYPFEGGVNLVSIGDICRWMGSLLFLLGNILLIPCILRRLFFSGKLS